MLKKEVYLMCYDQEYVFFPYSKEILPVVQYYLSQGVPRKNIKVYGYDGDFMAGQDIGLIESNEKFGIVLEENIVERISSNQIIYICSHKNQNEEILKRLVCLSLELGNKVFCKQQLGVQLLESIKSNWNDSEMFTYCPNSDVCHRDIADEKLYTFSVPVVYISELVPGYLGGTGILLNLRLRLEKAGYKVLVVGKGTLMEDVSLKRFLMDLEDNYAKKILLLNHFIWQEIQNHQYDIVFVETLDTLLRYNPQIIGNGFGMYTHLLSYAIPPDYLINCLSCEIRNEDREKICKSVANLLPGCEVFSICSPQIIYEENLFEPIQICKEFYPLIDKSTIAMNIRGIEKEIENVFHKLILDLKDL